MLEKIVGTTRAPRLRSLTTAALLAASLSAVAASCSGGDANAPENHPPASVSLVSGDAQQATVGTAVASPLVVKVTDADGQPVTGAAVVFQVTAGGGSIGDDTVFTTASGQASLATWTLGTHAGANTVSGRVGTLPAIAFTATGMPGAPARLAFTTQPTLAAVGAAIAPAVQVEIRDAHDNRVMTATDSVTLAFGANPTSGTLSGATRVAAMGGVAAFSTLAIDRAGAGYTLAASSGTLAGATSAPFDVDAPPGVTATSPANGATAVPTGGAITVTFSEPVNATTASFSLACPVGSARAFTLSASPATTFTLMPTTPLPAGTTCRLTVNAAAVSDADALDGPDAMTADVVSDFTTQQAFALVDDNWSAEATKRVTGNLTFNSGSGSAFSVVANDTLPAGATVSFVGAIAGSVGTTARSAQGGDVTMVSSGAGIGQFTYDPPAGYEGTDSFQYVVTDGARSDTATVTLSVSGMVWFVDNTAAACTTRASGCGRLTSPYSTLAAFAAENNGTGNNPAAGDNVFVYQRTTAYVGPLTLLASQKLVGQDATQSLEAITGIAPSAYSAVLPTMQPGDATATTITGATGALVLGQNNTVRGLTLAASGGIALDGNGFGTFTHGDLEISAVNAAALRLQNGALAGAFRKVSSSSASAASAVTLAQTTGTFTVTGSGTAGSGGTIQGASSLALSLTNTGPVSISWMTVQNNALGGLTANGVSGLMLRRSLFSGNGSSGTASSVAIVSSTGVMPVQIDTVTMTNSYYQAIDLEPTGGTVTLLLRGSTISGTNSTNGGTGVFVRGTNATVNATISGNTFSGTRLGELFYDVSGTGGAQVSITGNTFTGGGGQIAVSTGNLSAFSGAATFDIASNTMSGSTNAPLQVSSWSGTGSLQARIRNNTVGQPGVASSCSPNTGIYTLKNDGTAPFVLAVTDNQLYGCAGTGFYHAVNNVPGLRSDITFARNTMTLTQQAILLGKFGGGTPTADRFLCVDASANNISASVNPAWFTTGAVTLMLPGYTGSMVAGTTADANVDSYLRARNTLSSAPNSITTTSPGTQQAPTQCTQPNF